MKVREAVEIENNLTTCNKHIMNEWRNWHKNRVNEDIAFWIELKRREFKDQKFKDLVLDVQKNYPFGDVNSRKAESLDILRGFSDFEKNLNLISRFNRQFLQEEGVHKISPKLVERFDLINQYRYYYGVQVHPYFRFYNLDQKLHYIAYFDHISFMLDKKLHRDNIKEIFSETKKYCPDISLLEVNDFINNHAPSKPMTAMSSEELDRLTYSTLFCGSDLTTKPEKLDIGDIKH